MRNILQYPITSQECKELLIGYKNEIMIEYANGMIGDSRALVLSRIMEYIDTEDFDEWLRNYEDLEKYTR